MPLLQNAKKALRVSKRKAAINTRIRSKMRTMIKHAKDAPSQENLADAYSSIDKAVKRNLVHKNKAARLKSQLSSLLSSK